MNAKLKEKELSDKKYEEVLNELYGEVRLGGLTFDAGRIIRELDETAFNCGMADYEDSLPEVWLCGKCGDEFDEEEEAEDCCKD